MPQPSGEPQPLAAELIRDPEQILALMPAWRELAVARGNAFLTPEWFRAWNDHYAEQTPLVVSVSGASGELCGILPLMADRRGLLRAARFAGSSLGDHFELLATEGDELESARAIGIRLQADARLWRSLVLENVDTGAGWVAELSRATGCGPALIAERTYTLPYAQLAGRSWEEYLAGRSRNLRSQLGRKRRALERDHEVEIRWANERGDVETAMDTLFRLHDLRWAARAGSSSLTSARARAFHTAFATAAQARGWLRLAFLEVDSEPVAGWYGWRMGSRFAYYQAGFDPAWGRHSVGQVLFAETIRTAAEEGAESYEMLLGDEDFKLRFADAHRPVCTVMIAPRWRPARAIAAGEARMRRVARRLPPSIHGPITSGTRRLLDLLPLARRR